MQNQNDTIKIITLEKFGISKSGIPSCYYQVYKQDEHYEHSISAQRIHNLRYDYLEQKGVPLEYIIGVFRILGDSITFVAHNSKFQELLTRIKRQWICTLKRAREK